MTFLWNGHSSVIVEAESLTKEADQRIPESYLLLFPWSWDYKHVLPYVAFELWDLGVKFRFPHMETKQFIKGATHSPSRERLSCKIQTHVWWVE